LKQIQTGRTGFDPETRQTAAVNIRKAENQQAT
jgi:hypothetical protein